MSGASNTFSNIGNSSLVNNSITINGISTALGGSVGDLFTVQTLTPSGSITWDVSLGINAQCTIATTGITLAMTNMVAGHTYTFRIIQGSGGSKTITTWPSGTKWAGGSFAGLSTAAGAIDIVVFYYDGTTPYATLQKAFN